MARISSQDSRERFPGAPCSLEGSSLGTLLASWVSVSLAQRSPTKLIQATHRVLNFLAITNLGGKKKETGEILIISVK